MVAAAEDKVLILGIGNILWADEGFGVRVVETLHQRYAFPPDVQVVDGGTQGVYLLQYVQAVRRLLVFDAVDYGLEAGTLKVVLNEDVPSFLGARKMSLHQSGFQEVLACARLTGRYPEELVLIGVQPVELEDYGGSLRDEVKARIEPAIAIGLEYLAAWGVSPAPRAGALAPEERLNPTGMDIGTYEASRPGPEEACRIGDARFLAMRKQS